MWNVDGERNPWAVSNSTAMYPVAFGRREPRSS
jgi:hypothetical protein